MQDISESPQRTANSTSTMANYITSGLTLPGQSPFQITACRQPFLGVVTAACLGIVAAIPARADTILYWNEVLNEAITAQPMGPSEASRIMAMVNTSMFDAVNAIDGRFRSFAFQVSGAPGNASMEAAAAQAAHDTLSALFPNQQASFSAALAGTLSNIGDPTAMALGRALGAQSASAMLASRAADGSDAVMTHTTVNQPGHWQPTAPDFSTAYTPDWGAVTPFSLADASQFRPVAPPALTSSEYAAAYEEVKLVGAKNSPVRTADQEQMGLFWAYDVGTIGPPPVLYNQITAEIARTQGNSLTQNARLFALTSLAQADAGIAAWEAKYVYDYWRPITAIREGDNDGNDATIGDADWLPLGAPGDGLKDDFTPPFPAYVSGHATFGAAAMGMIAEFYGTDDISFTIGSDEYDGVLRPKVTRSFDRLSEAILENALSRMYLGIHWRFDAEAGIDMGYDVAEWVYSHSLTPVPEPSAMVLLLTLLPCASIGLRRGRQDPSCRLKVSSAR